MKAAGLISSKKENARKLTVGVHRNAAARVNAKCWHCFWPENVANPFSGNVSDTSPKNTRRIRSVAVSMILRKTMRKRMEKLFGAFLLN